MNLPTGTVTFLFTDIEGSTRQWDVHPEAMGAALRRHDALIRHSIESNGGAVFKTVGDAFCAAFSTASDALQAALEAQIQMNHRGLRGEDTEVVHIRVRMALYTGMAEERDGDYFGPSLNRVARLLSTGYGGQILLSQTTHDLIRDSRPADVTLQDMGQHRLKDLLAPEHVWQLQHPSLPTQFPPLKSLDYLPTNLPRQITSFIGREQEMAQVKSVLKSAALVTLTGTGGTGKTRLALQVGADVLEEYKDGVWLVELAAIADPALVPQSIATALQLREEAGRSLLQTVEDYLRDRQLLLILDNCEHLVSACARVCETLLKACPRLTIQATSREPLGISGERSWRTPSLLTPDPDALSRDAQDVTGALMSYDAPRLFMERAVAHRQDFVLRDTDAPVVARLCQQLDSIPLAIELAAARVRSLSLEEIEARLNNRFRLLTGGSRTALPRQQTLKALIDWSYDLLNEKEKALLCRLSVFSGGWRLEATEQVCAGDAIEDWEVLDLLTSLVDKSLVVYEETEEKERYRLLETVRQYARYRLVESSQSDALRARHRDYFLAFAEEAEPKLKGPEQIEWLQRLEEEHENLRAALDGSLSDAGSSSGCLRLCGALQRFWWMRGHLSEGREWCVRALGKVETQERGPARAKALNGAGVLAWMQGDYASAHGFFEESLTLVRETGDREGIATSLNNLGNMAYSQGDYASSRVYHEESLNIMRQVGDREGVARSLSNLGNVAGSQGDYASARAYNEESLAIRRETGDRGGIATALHNLGSAADCQGDYAYARACYKESLALQREIDNRMGVAQSLEAFARLIAAQEPTEQAARLWGAAERLREEIGSALQPNERESYERGVVSVRAALGEETFLAAWEKGHAMTLEEAIALALAGADC